MIDREIFHRATKRQSAFRFPLYGSSPQASTIKPVARVRDQALSARGALAKKNAGQGCPEKEERQQATAEHDDRGAALGDSCRSDRRRREIGGRAGIVAGVDLIPSKRNVAQDAAGTVAR